MVKKSGSLIFLASVSQPCFVASVDLLMPIAENLHVAIDTPPGDITGQGTSTAQAEDCQPEKPPAGACTRLPLGVGATTQHR